VKEGGLQSIPVPQAEIAPPAAHQHTRPLSHPLLQPVLPSGEVCSSRAASINPSALESCAWSREPIVVERGLDPCAIVCHRAFPSPAIRASPPPHPSLLPIPLLFLTCVMAAYDAAISTAPTRSSGLRPTLSTSSTHTHTPAKRASPPPHLSPSFPFPPLLTCAMAAYDAAISTAPTRSSGLRPTINEEHAHAHAG
jgi:hypothetical protein